PVENILGRFQPLKPNQQHPSDFFVQRRHHRFGPFVSSRAGAGWVVRHAGTSAGKQAAQRTSAPLQSEPVCAQTASACVERQKTGMCKCLKSYALCVEGHNFGTKFCCSSKWHKVA